MVDLIDQGVHELGELVKELHKEFKDVLNGISEKDIHNIIAGEYNDKKNTKSELLSQVQNIQEEAKLINKLESLMNNEPKNEKIKRERNIRITELQKQIKDFKKDNPNPLEQLKSIKKRNELAENKLKEKIANNDFSTKKNIPFEENILLKKYNPKLYKETMDAIVAKDEAKYQFNLSKRQDELNKRSFFKKVIDFGLKSISTSKNVKAGIDDSVTFVQLGMAILANPKSGVKAKLEAIKGINNKNFKRQLAALHNSPYWNTIKLSGLDITEPKSLTKENLEEVYSGNLLDKDFKVNGKRVNLWTNTGGVFERLFTGMGNNMRLNMFMKRAEMLESEGKTFDSHPQEYKDAARVINELTGRGKVNEHLQAAMPAISPIIWAPKMMSSSLNLLGIGDIGNAVVGKKGLYASLTPSQRKYAFTQMGKGIGMGITVMGALAMAGWDTDFDPRSNTFGSVSKGTKTYNVFGRYAGMVKTITQILTGNKKTKYGTTDLDEKGGRGKVLGKFFRGKMTPFSGEAYDYIFNSKENSFTREPINLSTLPNDLLTPISLSDLKKGMEQDGSISLITRFLPAFEGVQVYDSRDFDESNKSSIERTAKDQIEKENKQKLMTREEIEAERKDKLEKLKKTQEKKRLIEEAKRKILNK